MIFSSIFFLSVFLPVTLALYFLAPKALRNGVLLVASLIFYAWGEPVYIVLMFYSTVLDYTCGIMMERYDNNNKKRLRFLWVSMIGNLGLLGFFKYYDFFSANLNTFLGVQLPIMNLALPIGISFYTFQTMSYSIDVYLRNCKVQRNIVSFGCYVTMFPQLIAGPIVRYVDVVREIDHRKESIDEFAYGIRLFIIGLGKKVLLANAIGSLWDTVYTTFQHDQNISMMSAWLGILAFSFQLYFDFSGYSDMATGMGHMFGFRFPKNFNYPYTSLSVSDFWRRWHMTLGTWFKEYVYIPLGGNKRYWLRNVVIVWLLTGLWHGADWNYVIWGVYFGAVLVIEKTLLQPVLIKLPVVLRWIYTTTLVIIAWVLFSIESLPLSLQYLKILFGIQGSPLVDRFAFYQWTSYGFLFVILAIASTPFWKILLKRWTINDTQIPRLSENHHQSLSFMSHQVPNWVTIAFTSYCFVILLFVMAYLVDASYNPFLYFRF